jgi:hypothetical protein
MEYSEFLAIGLRLQKLQRRTQALYKLDLDLINFENDYWEVFDLLLRQAFTEEQYEWVSWFIHENDFGQKGMEARDEHGNLICQSWESLWEYLNRENDSK